jgi:hypothetical protein
VMGDWGNKRLARQVCKTLIRSIPRKLCEWDVVKIPSVTFEYCTAEDHNKEMMLLEERIRKAWTLPGTQKIHCVIPASKNQVLFRSKCVQNYTYSTLARWRISNGRHYRICNLRIWQKVVVCVCVLQVNDWNSTNIFASLWSQ